MITGSSEVLRLLAEGWILKSGPFGPWVEKGDDENENVHARTVSGMAQRGVIVADSVSGEIVTWRARP